MREEFTLVRMDRHSGQLEELDIQGILTFEPIAGGMKARSEEACRP